MKVTLSTLKLTRLITAMFVLMFMAMCNLAVAVDEIDASDFVDEASAKGIAEIETAKLALRKSNSAEVKAFAQMLIDDHTAANKELANIALRKKLEVSTEAELMNKAKAYILKQRDGESFDEAFAENQVEAHKDAIELFKEAAVSDDAELAAFAAKTLPKLEHHLQTAKNLADNYTDD